MKNCQWNISVQGHTKNVLTQEILLNIYTHTQNENCQWTISAQGQAAEMSLLMRFCRTRFAAQPASCCRHRAARGGLQLRTGRRRGN